MSSHYDALERTAKELQVAVVDLAELAYRWKFVKTGAWLSMHLDMVVRDLSNFIRKEEERVHLPLHPVILRFCSAFLHGDVSKEMLNTMRDVTIPEHLRR